MGMWHLGTLVRGGIGSAGEWLGWMILKGFSNNSVVSSMILFLHEVSSDRRPQQ